MTALHEAEGIDVDKDSLGGNFLFHAKIEAGGKRAGELRALRRFEQELKAVIALEAGERRGGGAKNL